MKYLTNQEIFDKVTTHLLTQGRKSQTFGGVLGPMCSYRTPDGLSCAVGCLFPPEIDVKPIENSLVDTAMSKAPGLFKQAGIAKKHLHLLQELQTVHDRNHPNRWLTCLANVATNFDLTTPAILSQRLKEC